MKRILLLTMVFFSIFSYAQFPEGFEGATFPPTGWVVEDNGVGRTKSEQINKNFKSHNSFATKAIDTRIALINKIAASKIEIKVEDKISNSNESLGTKIVILIPVKNI